MGPIIGLLIAVVVVGLILSAWYFAWIKPSADRKRIATETPAEVQVATFEQIFNGRTEVSTVRTRIRLSDEELESIAVRHGYTFARYFQTNKGGAKQIIFRRVDAGPGRRFGRAQEK